MPFNVQSIAKKFINRKIVPIRVDNGSDITDPAIWITESIYIQVGKDYIVIFRDRLNDLAIYQSTHHIDDIIGKLKQAIDEGK